MMLHLRPFYHTSIGLVLAVLAAGNLACNLTTYLMPTSAPTTPDLRATAAVALAATFTAQGAAPTQAVPVVDTPVAVTTMPALGVTDTPLPPTEPLVAATPTLVGTVARSSVALSPTADACALIPAAQVEALLGEPLGQPSSGPGVCVTAGQSGQRSFTVVLQPVDAAKAALLNTLAQFKSGCSQSFRSGTNITPTPLPPDIQALSSKSLPELMALVADGYQKCNSPEGYQVSVPVIGDASYISRLDMGFLQTVYLLVASGDMYASFTYAATNKDEALSKQDALVNMVSAALSSSP